jgi:hypothetical protein
MIFSGEFYGIERALPDTGCACLLMIPHPGRFRGWEGIFKTKVPNLLFWAGVLVPMSLDQLPK